jgi:hypothetical protein
LKSNNQQPYPTAQKPKGNVDRAQTQQDRAYRMGARHTRIPRHIKKVSHLVQINHDPAPPKPARVPPAYDQTADATLMRELAFDQNNIVLETYDDAALKKGKPPDFKLLKDGKVCGF